MNKEGSYDLASNLFLTALLLAAGAGLSVAPSVAEEARVVPAPAQP